MRKCLPIALMLLGAPAAADPYKEFTGLRAEAMGGAHRGLGTSNDTIFLNPAGMAIHRRFSIDGFYGYSGRGDLHHISFSALDSKTGPIGGALAYTHDRGDHSRSDVDLHRFYLASSYPIFDWLGVGLTGRHVRGGFVDESGVRQNVETYSFDLGLSALFWESLGIGVTYHNVVSTSRPRMTPPHVGVGLSFSYAGLVLASDMEIDLRARHAGDITAGGGVEYFLLDMIPLRFGYRYRPREKRDGSGTVWEHVLGGGLGLVAEWGGLEATYTHAIDFPKDWNVIGSLKLFL